VLGSVLTAACFPILLSKPLANLSPQSAHPPAKEGHSVPWDIPHHLQEQRWRTQDSRCTPATGEWGSGRGRGLLSHLSSPSPQKDLRDPHRLGSACPTTYRLLQGSSLGRRGAVTRMTGPPVKEGHKAWKVPPKHVVS
jgi:hypothetical protein